MSDFHPELYNGNIEAARLIDDLCYVAHVWDDLIDKDKQRTNAEINKCFRILLVDIPSNLFYRQNVAVLTPLIYSGVLGFLTANEMESSGDAHSLEIAHGLRYSVANVAAFCVAMTQPENAIVPTLTTAWKQWMPERFEDYRKEHCHVD